MKSQQFIILAVFAATILYFSCGGGSNPKRTELEIRDGKPVLTMYSNSSTPNPLTPSDIDMELEELTGYKVDKTFLVADQATSSGVLLASGEYADLLNMREDTQKFIDAGVFIPLEKLIRENAPRIYELYRPYWEQIKSLDGHIYVIPEIYPLNSDMNVILGTSGIGVGMYIQKAVLEWAGYPLITTLAEYFDLLKRYRDAFPEIDGQATIAFSFPAEGWRFNYMIYSASYLSGYPNESGPLIDCMQNGNIDYESNPCVGKWVPRDPFAGQEFHDTLQIYNRAYLDGLMVKEAVVQTHDQYNEKIASGRVLGVFDQEWEFSGAQDVLRLEMPDRVLYNVPVVLKEGIRIFNAQEMPNYEKGWGISVKAPDPVAAIKFLDANLSKEAIVLTNWGIKDKDYLVGADGMYYRTEKMRAQAHDRRYRATHWGDSLIWVVHGVFSDGNSVIPDSQPAEYFAQLSEAEKELAGAYNVKSMGELFPPLSNRRIKFSPLWTFTFDKTKDRDYLKVEERRAEITRQYFAKLVFAEEGLFEAIWHEYNEQMASIPNADIWLETWQNRLADRIASWD